MATTKEKSKRKPNFDFKIPLPQKRSKKYVPLPSSASSTISDISTVDEKKVTAIRRTLTIPWALTGPQLAYCGKHWLDFNLVEISNARMHSHARLAVERTIAEQDAYDLLVRRNNINIVDIGGCPDRHERANRNIHSCCPVISPADNTRNTRFLSCRNWCQHRVEQCKCVQPDAYMSINSLYYLTPDIVLSCIIKSKNKTLISVHHQFDVPYGSFADGEAHYRVDSDETVTMHVVGNSHSYKHSTMSWLRVGYYCGDISGQRFAMSWSTLRNYPNSVLVVFNECPIDLFQTPTITPRLASATLNSNYWGTVLTGPMHGIADTSVSLANTLLSDAKILSFGPIFAIFTFSDFETSVVVPKDLVFELAAVVVGNPRTPSTFTTLLETAKRKIKNLQLPPQHTALAISYSAALAFVLNIDREITTYNQVLAPKKSHFAALNSILKFDFYINWRLWFGWLIQPVKFTFNSLYRLSTYSWGHMRDLAKSSTYACRIGHYLSKKIDTFCSYIPIVRTYCRPFLKRLVINDVYHKYAINRTSSLIPDGLYHHFPVLLPSTTTTAPLEAMNVSAKIQLPTTLTDIDRDVLYSVGPVFPASIPIVPSSNGINQQCAVRNRQLKLQIPHNVDVVDDFCSWVKKNVLFLFDPKQIPNDHILPIDFNAWLSRFPVPVQKNIQIARDKWLATNLVPHKAFSHKCFVKMEPLLKSRVTGLTEFNPRLISGSSDWYNGVCGPWVFGFSKWLMSSWSSNWWITYASGHTGESLGQWIDSTLGLNVKYIEGDIDKFDSSVIKQLLEITNWIFEFFGCPKDVIDVMTTNITKLGATPEGIRFSILGTVCSGDPDTTLRNSLIMGLLNAYFMCLHHKVTPEQMASNICHYTVSKVVTPLASLRTLPVLTMLEQLPKPQSTRKTVWREVKKQESKYDSGINDEKFRELPNVRPRYVHSEFYFRILVMGDDNLIVNTSKDMPTPVYMTDSFNAIGMKAKINFRDVIYEVEFCSSRFWPTTGGFVLGPKIGRVLSKIGWHIVKNAVTQQNFNGNQHIRGVALGLQNNCSHVPFLHELINTILRVTRNEAALPENRHFRIDCEDKHEYVDETWTMLDHLYGLKQTDLIGWKNTLDGIYSFPVSIGYRLFDSIFERDTA